MFNHELFYWRFLNNLYLGEGCYDFKFAKIPRPGDITLCDLWGVAAHLKNEKGVSLLLVNSVKGKELIEKTESLVLNKVEISDAKRGIPRLYSGKCSDHKEKEL